MLGEATLDALGTFLGEAIRVLILFVAQQIRLSRSRSRGFPQLSGPGRAAWVGRDTRAREYLAERR